MIMIGLIPNFFAVVSAISNQPSAKPVEQNRAAADIHQCPAVANIRSTPYTDPDLPAPYGEGFKYVATTPGKTWTGQTAATNDDFLDPEYELKAEEIHERNNKTFCDYGGKRLIKEGAVSDPYLRLSTLT